jgi:hypothetical protein
MYDGLGMNFAQNCPNGIYMAMAMRFVDLGFEALRLCIQAKC